MSRILKSPRAKADLADIWDYIAEDSEARADAFVATIDQKFQVLADRPSIGRKRDEIEEGIRSFPVGKYVTFYRALPDGADIIRVLHSARDLDSIFDAGD